MMQLEKVIMNPELDPFKVEKASVAAKGLYLWIIAIREYYYVIEEIKPKRNALIQSEAQFEEIAAKFELKKEELKDLNEKNKELKLKFSELQKEVSELKAKLDHYTILTNNANKLIGTLSIEKQKWLVLTRILQNVTNNIS
jgi:dynein heavy chain, axonemal